MKLKYLFNVIVVSYLVMSTAICFAADAYSGIEPPSSRVTKVFIVKPGPLIQRWHNISYPMRMRFQQYPENGKIQTIQTIATRLMRLLNTSSMDILTPADAMPYIKSCLSKIVDSGPICSNGEEHWQDSRRGLIHYLNATEDGNVHLHTRFGDEYNPERDEYYGFDCFTDIKLI